MFKMPKKIEYALPEKIGNPELFVGRTEEFDFFLGDWYRYLEKNFTQNQAILSRRKKGKSAFMQRLFNILWSAGAEKKEGELEVIPFYYSIKDSDQMLGEFAIDFFTKFVSQYTSYQTRNRLYISGNLQFDSLNEIIEDEQLKVLYDTMAINEKKGNWQRLWAIASEAPATVARLNGVKIVQIIDEFQYINEYIYDKEKEKIEGMSGTYMHVSEMREAPLIVSGSEVHWLLKIVRSLTGRFQTYSLGNLPKEEAEEAIEKYAAFSDTKINQLTKEKIWELTNGDPLYIKALFISRFNKKKDYTNVENIVDVYEEEITHGEIYGTWMEYMLKTFDTVNKINSKRIMLYLFKQGKERTRAEIIKDLKLKDSDKELEKKLAALIAGDLISQGSTAYRYSITQDKTYEFFFRRKYQDEIDHFIPDIKAEIRKLIGKENYVKGKFQEFLIKDRLKKLFQLDELTENGSATTIIPEKIEERIFKKMGLKTYEIDLVITAEKQKLYVDIKNTKSKYGKREAERWIKITQLIHEEESDVLFLTYSENGYTRNTAELLKDNNILIIK